MGCWEAAATAAAKLGLVAVTAPLPPAGASGVDCDRAELDAVDAAAAAAAATSRRTVREASKQISVNSVSEL